ncbi:hypothetical protein D3C75_718640 [compost metagenome]
MLIQIIFAEQGAGRVHFKQGPQGDGDQLGEGLADMLGAEELGPQLLGEIPQQAVHLGQVGHLQVGDKLLLNFIGIRERSGPGIDLSDKQHSATALHHLVLQSLQGLAVRIPDLGQPFIAAANSHGNRNPQQTFCDLPYFLGNMEGFGLVVGQERFGHFMIEQDGDMPAVHPDHQPFRIMADNFFGDIDDCIMEQVQILLRMPSHIVQLDTDNRVAGMLQRNVIVPGPVGHTLPELLRQ